MKTARDPRHQQRIKVMQELFAWDFKEANQLNSESANRIGENIKKIDKYIQDAAPAWPLDKINKIDLAILRLAVFELLIEPKTPPKVIVDEAVELAKEYGSESSSSFINGALGKLITDYKISS
jgi:transcription antitermination factor NusB